MCLSFPKFGLCEGSWKAEVFAVICYPDWSSKVRNSSTILRKKASKGKRKHEDNSEIKFPSKNQKQKIKPTLPPVNLTIIDLDDDHHHMDTDPPSASALQTATTTSTSLVPSSTTTTPFTSTDSTSLSPVVIPSTLSQDRESSMILTRSVDSTSTTTPSSISNAIVPTAAIATPTIAAIVAPTAAIVASTVATSPATSMATVAPTAAVIAPSVAVIAPAAPVVATVDDVLTPVAMNSSNPMENAPRLIVRLTLFVPRPPEEAPIIGQTPMAPVLASGTTKKASKGDDKQLSIGKVLSARNLYAEEYKKSHPHITTGEYRVLWDNIDKATCKVKKAERKAGKALITAAQAGDATEP
ncbi:hypothetical protein K443DRAFT_2533 [Laccaria amethystina LaAM-08-1]|uniref:Uncharacterized protein n=1 Tax=Laccaria amethystina LaAM-08-1 TaxID=1095629 RepID=A0A0C9XPJ3_9AGAR|nr:hypothetical protein K443DRAFT_2533 [Laccaria amethystina LaAM-08-1]